MSIDQIGRVNQPLRVIKADEGTKSVGLITTDEGTVSLD
jgi:hypothetical protein